MAGAQDLVTESDWRGTTFRELAASQLARLGQTTLDGIEVLGDNPVLGPNAALHIGLAIHELATNALLHGALADGRHGLIRLALDFPPIANRPLVLEWREHSGTSSLAEAPRFGTLVLERIVPLSMRGTMTYGVLPDLVTYRLEVPRDQVAN